MNRNHHRIVFNAARGQLMAVSECARSLGKASTCTVTTAAASLLFCLPLQAQISADPGAPGSLRATVLTAPNGVPLVNITTPSAAGVSRNVYQQFDVGTQGASHGAEGDDTSGALLDAGGEQDGTRSPADDCRGQGASPQACGHPSPVDLEQTIRLVVEAMRNSLGRLLRT